MFNRTSLACLVVCCASLILASCTKSPEARTPPEHTYVVKGVIARMPQDDKSREMLIRHEKIQEFFESDGKASEMHSMTMPFPIAPQILLDGFAVGDEIQFTYEMRWNSKPREEVTSLIKLPLHSVNFDR